jgi:hypothetical protein
MVAVAVFLYSCSGDDAIFDESAADRTNAAVKEYREILYSAPNGWIMEYYASVEPDKIGGIVFLCSFDENGNVTIASETGSGDGKYAPKDKETSLYQVIADQGPVLTFDTYSSLLHAYSEPKGTSQIHGMMGDYEFVMEEVTPEKIVMAGKKYGNKIVMTAMKAEQSWDSYLDDVIEMSENNYFPKYTLLINNSEAATVSGSYDTRKCTFAQGNEQITTENIIYTPEGFKFYNPVTIGDVTFENFRWDAAQSSFVCTDQGASVVLKGYYPDGYKDYQAYTGIYTFNYSDLNGAVHNLEVEVQELENGGSYLIAGAGDFDFVAGYNRETGRLSITSQYITNYASVYEIYLYNWLGGYSIDSGSSNLYEGIVTSDVPLVMEFRSNNPGSGHVGFVYIAVQGSTPYLWAEEAFFTNVVMTKK